MDTFVAVPRIQRFPITVVDQTRLEEFYASSDLDVEIPTKTEIYIGYEEGPGTPTPVQIEVDQIETEYVQNLPSDEDREALSANQYADKWRRVNMLLRRNLLLAVIRNLDTDSANVLASEDGQGRELLVRLGWLEERTITSEDETAVENKEEGEGESGKSISSTSQRRSRASTS